jgi:deazaflavin-dependent oxidoreductase (nitroreductase family)
VVSGSPPGPEPVDPTSADRLERLGRDLAAQGRVAWLVTRGRVTGRPRGVAVGYLDEPDGSVLVAATSPRSAWALNLLADPGVEVVVGDRRFSGVAEELDRADHGRAVSGLILRYGTPSEGLGTGPSFRIRPDGVAGH